MGGSVRAHGRELGLDVAGLALAIVLPSVLWHETVAKIADGFRVEFTYLVTGWAPWILMLIGIVFLAAVILDRIRDPGRRFYGTHRSVWLGWGITLYLLGFMLATQVAQIAGGLSTL